ncbi:hypothetical protein GCM10027341_26300 [Spirosoma knui]
MKTQLLVCALAACLMSCQQDHDIQPNASLVGHVAGTYKTNVFLDPSRVAMPAGQLPCVELTPESDSTVTLVYTRSASANDRTKIPQIGLSRQADAILLKTADASIGTLQTERIFTNSGMEKQGQLLRLSIVKEPDTLFNFAGVKQ